MKIQLNEGQLIILHWLQEKYKLVDISPMELIWRLRLNSNKKKYLGRYPYKAYRYMNKHQQAEILAVFSDWLLQEEQ